MDENTTSAAPNDDLLRKLALALLVPRYSGESYEEPQLLVGELPPDLPFEVPLPEGARVLGTLLGSQTITAIEAALAPEDVVEFYRTALAAEGWREAAIPGYGRGGFLHTNPNRMAMVTFDRDEEGPSLRLMCFETRGGGASIQLHVEAQPSPPNQARQRAMMRGRDVMSVLPAIQAPPRSTQQPGGGGGSNDHVSSQATLETDLDVPAVGAHYRQQLERAGWEQRGAGENGPVAWSAWTFNDDEGEPWSAMFAALQEQIDVPGHYQLWISANRVGGSEGTGPSPRMIGSQMRTGWTYYSPARRGGSIGPGSRP